MTMKSVSSMILSPYCFFKHRILTQRKRKQICSLSLWTNESRHLESQEWSSVSFLESKRSWQIWKVGFRKFEVRYLLCMKVAIRNSQDLDFSRVVWLRVCEIYVFFKMVLYFGSNVFIIVNGFMHRTYKIY